MSDNNEYVTATNLYSRLDRIIALLESVLADNNVSEKESTHKEHDDRDRQV